MIVEAKRMQQGVGIIYLSGALNTDSLGAFKEEIAALADEGFESIVVDCRELGSISSSGLASLIWAKRKAHAKGSKVYFTHVSATIAEVLAITKLSSLLSIEATTRGFLERRGFLRKKRLSPVRN